MTRINATSEKVKMKLSLGDYPLLSPKEIQAPDAVESVAPTPPPVSENKPVPVGRRIYAIPKKDMKRLEEVFRNRLDTEKQGTISTLMSEAIQLLYVKEYSL